jgi:hypothetical protein
MRANEATRVHYICWRYGSRVAAYGELLIDFWCRPRSSAGAASMGTKKMRHAIVKSLF